MLSTEDFLKILKEEGCEIQIRDSLQLEEIVYSINDHFDFEDQIEDLINRAKDHIKDVSNSNIDMYLKDKQINHWLAYISALESVNALIQGL